MNVHVLHHGLSLCRFTTDLPGNWPIGHRWTGLDDRAPVNCPGCLRVLSAIDHRRAGARCGYPECGGGCVECEVVSPARDATGPASPRP